MTVLVAGLALVLTIAAGGVFGVFANVASDRVRAQTAADAAALAAVAELAPGEFGAPEQEAEVFAAANGAELLECFCELGTTAVQVAVSVDGVEAEARAVIDPNSFLPANLGYDARGVHPRLRRALDELLAAGRGRITVTSGWRSYEEQQQLWQQALAKYGDPEVADDWVARPGHSNHESGLAVDLGGDVELAARLVDQLDLPMYRPLTNEPWHFELRGSR